ncbi:MAG TPA: DUF1501 domain-containing protein [Pirellulaceae bacterium]|nr:DUF1501 domain-containing protein [Pirellulaceae bacterium]
MMDPSLYFTRRHFLRDCRIGLGAMALGSLLAKDGVLNSAAAAESTSRSRANDPLAPQPTHFPPRAKNIIFMFMAGGPSQLELFNPKPKLQELTGKQIPESFVANKRFAFIKQDAKLMGTKRKFEQHGQSGQTISECLPHLASIADDICTLRAVKTDVFNHGPAKFFMNTGSPLFGRPALGAWVTWGIGSEAESLPGFVVLQSGPRGPRGGAPNWGSGFLPTAYQGVPFRSVGQPILNLDNPAGIKRDGQERFIDAVNDLNRLRLAETGDGEIATRIAAYEMAFRMQASAPELMDLSGESQETLQAYGVEPGKPSFAMNCLLARRLVERGVRMVQLYHTDWDHHGNKGTELGESLDKICLETDQGAAALVKDLKQRGLLKDTIVVWGGEFGRTPQAEPRELIGRDHHVESFTMWLAGGGIKPGLSLGQTDEIGYYGVEDQVHVHDLHATLLHLMGLDHLKLTYRFQGRDFRLTDVFGKVVEKMLA